MTNRTRYVLLFVCLALGIAILISGVREEEKKTQDRVTGFLKLTPGQMEKQPERTGKVLIQKRISPLPERLSAHLTVQFPNLELLPLPPMPPDYPLDDPFVCSGDFNGDGLKDFALVLHDKGKDELILVAFHQKSDGAYTPFTLAIMSAEKLPEIQSFKILLMISCVKWSVDPQSPAFARTNHSIVLNFDVPFDDGSEGRFEHYDFINDEYVRFHIPD